MPEPALVHVSLAERSYDIEIGAGSLAELGEFVNDRVKFSRAIVITDENVNTPHGESAAGSLADFADVDVLVVPPGEASKSLRQAEALWETMLESGADRWCAVVAVGGGVVGDLAGFVAATYARGVAYIQVPTTLLAQVDSSVGGKVAVNLSQAKNMIGAFWQPAGVLIDTVVLATLGDREYRAGLAEVVKYGAILDAGFFAFLESHVDDLNRRDDGTLRRAIQRSCELKADIVSRDERELTGLRSVLNYGHTFAHAIEALTGYDEWLHGEAVSIGMMQAARLAEKLGRIDGAFVQRQRDLLSGLKLPVDPPTLSADEVVSVMLHDKKAVGGRLRFVLPTRLGHVELVDNAPAEEVRKVL